MMNEKDKSVEKCLLCGNKKQKDPEVIAAEEVREKKMKQASISLLEAFNSQISEWIVRIQKRV